MYFEATPQELYMGKRKEGICVICQNYGKLSREHFPPKKAFNNESYKVQGVNLHKLNKGTVSWYEKWKHGGNARFVTCEKCNNLAGAWYAPSYIDFVTKIEPYSRPRNAGLGEI